MEKFNNHNQFIGFYQDGLRINHGEFFIGNVQEEIGERGEIKLKYDMKHEGPWRAGIMRSGGAVTFSATRNAWPSMNKKSARYEFLSNLKSNEDLATKRQNKQKKKVSGVCVCVCACVWRPRSLLTPPTIQKRRCTMSTASFAR